MVFTNYSLFEEERTAEADLSQGPSAYQPNALPRGQTGSQDSECVTVAFLQCVLVISTEVVY